MEGLIFHELFHENPGVAVERIPRCYMEFPSNTQWKERILSTKTPSIPWNDFVEKLLVNAPQHLPAARLAPKPFAGALPAGTAASPQRTGADHWQHHGHTAGRKTVHE
jgi:hypothetical protein